MKNTLITGILSLLVLLATPLLLAVDPPGILNHQGSISVGGNKFSGTGYFKFVLKVNAGGPLWSNDNTFPGTTFEPIGYVPVSVTDGNYSVVLGWDAGMPPIHPSVFINNTDVELRIWFSQNSGGPYTQLSPSRRVAPAAYAFSAGSAVNAENLGGIVSAYDDDGITEINLLGSEEIARIRFFTPTGSVNSTPTLRVQNSQGESTMAFSFGSGTAFEDSLFAFRGTDNKVTSGTYVDFRVDGNLRVPTRTVTIGGGVGGNPSSIPLEVIGFTGFTVSGYYNLGPGGGSVQSGTATASASIRATHTIVGADFVATSDERIKEIAGVSNGEKDLDTLLGIEVTDYSFIDKVAKGSRSQKKVIAQQVESVYPQAVSLLTDAVPDIYKKASINDGWVELATDLKVGERVRLLSEEETGTREVLEIREGAFRTAFDPTGNDVFVYGREVEDFRLVDYEAISMLNVSATQELYRKNVALEKRVAALEAENAARDAKLTAIEKMLGNAGANLASFKTVGATAGQ